MRWLLLIIALLLLNTVSAVPSSLNVNGEIKNGTRLLNETITVRLSIYNNSGGIAGFNQSSQVIVSNGFFSSYLYGLDPLWFYRNNITSIGISVGDDGEATPRMNLSSVAYAFVSDYVLNPDVSLRNFSIIRDFGANCGSSAIAKFNISTNNFTCIAVGGVGSNGAFYNVTWDGGLQVSPSNNFSINTSQTQVRVTGTCPAGNSIREIAIDGTVTCESDSEGVTSVIGTSGISDVTITSTGTLQLNTSWLITNIINTANITSNYAQFNGTATTQNAYLTAIASNLTASNVMSNGTDTTQNSYLTAIATNLTNANIAILLGNATGTTLYGSKGANVNCSAGQFVNVIGSGASSCATPTGSVDTTNTTIWGNVTVFGSLLPGTNGTQMIGNSTYPWVLGYFRNVILNTLDVNDFLLITFNNISILQNWAGSTTANISEIRRSDSVNDTAYRNYFGSATDNITTLNRTVTKGFGQGCFGGQVVNGTSANGTVSCISPPGGVDYGQNITTLNTSVTKTFSQTCPSGQVVNGTTANGTIGCVVDQSGGGGSPTPAPYIIVGNNTRFGKPTVQIPREVFIFEEFWGDVANSYYTTQGTSFPNITLTDAIGVSDINSGASAGNDAGITIVSQNTGVAQGVYNSSAILIQEYRVRAPTNTSGGRYLIGSFSPSVALNFAVIANGSFFNFTNAPTTDTTGVNNRIFATTCRFNVCNSVNTGFTLLNFTYTTLRIESNNTNVTFYVNEQRISKSELNLPQNNSVSWIGIMAENINAARSLNFQIDYAFINMIR